MCFCCKTFDFFSLKKFVLVVLLVLQMKTSGSLPPDPGLMQGKTASTSSFPNANTAHLSGCSHTTRSSSTPPATLESVPILLAFNKKWQKGTT